MGPRDTEQDLTTDLTTAEARELQRRLDDLLRVAPEWTGPDTLTTARRARSRRRAVTAGVLVAAAASVGLVAALPRQDADDGSRARDVAAGPPASEAPTDAGPPPPPPGLSDLERRNWDAFIFFGDLAQLQEDGTLFLRPGVEVLQRAANPGRVDLPSRSLGLVLRDSGSTTWAYLTHSGGTEGASGSTSVFATPEEAAPAEFEEWVARVARGGAGESSAEDNAVIGDDGVLLVDLDADGTVVAAPGVEVQEERVLVDRPGEHVVAVRFTHAGRQRWAALWAEVLDGRLTGSGTRSTFPVTGSSFSTWVRENAVGADGRPVR